jgi:Ca2+-binding EF-hand superfamily protein
MKRKLIIGGLAALTLTAGGAALAQQAPQYPQDPPRHARGDKDGDGRISRAEFVEGRIARLTAADANRDGTVTPEEMRAAGEARRAEAADRMFARLDADGNGAVTRAEFDAARAERGDRRAELGERRGGRGMHRGGGRRGGMGMERGPIVIAEAQARAEQGFAQLDANGDGYVTAEERRAMRGERRSRQAAASE